MHNIEFVRFLRNGFDEIQVMGEGREQLSPIEPQCSFAHRSEVRRCLRVSTREQSYVMSQRYKFFCNI
jgi:hypothetical protein